MSLKKKLSLIEFDATGTIIKIKESTGLYDSTENPDGYGGPNISISDILKIIFTASRFNSEVVHSVVFARSFDPDYPLYITDPSIDQVANGASIQLNSIMLGMNEASEGLVPFRDSVWDINQYSVTEEVTGVVGNEGQPFITGNGFSEIIDNCDAILVDDMLYDIDKSKPSSGGTVIYLTEELQSSTVSFEPAYRANLKVLMDSQTQYGTRELAVKSARKNTSARETAYEVIVHLSAAHDAMDCGSYDEANWNINESYRLVKSKCGCK